MTLVDKRLLADKFVIGPTSNIANTIAVFSGTTGDHLADSGKTISDMLPVIQRNKPNGIINGDFDIWQRGITQTTSGYGSDDRWRNVFLGGSLTNTRQSHTIGQTDVLGNPKYYSRSVVTHAVGVGNFHIKEQRMESVRTFAGKKVTVTYWAKADGAKPIAVEFIQSFGSVGSPSADIPIPVAKPTLTTGWLKYTHAIDLPSIAGKVIGSANDDYLDLVFWFEAGSNFNAQTNSLGQQSGTFEISHVSVVEGDATLEIDPFVPRTTNEELSRCQYFFRHWDYATNNMVSMMQAYSVGAAFGPLRYIDPPMRAIPVPSLSNIVHFSPYNASGATSPPAFADGTSSLKASRNMVYIDGITGSSGLVAGNAVGVYANQAAWIEASAEL